jgi:hypothetical protein
VFLGIISNLSSSGRSLLSILVTQFDDVSNYGGFECDMYPELCVGPAKRVVVKRQSAIKKWKNR